MESPSAIFSFPEDTVPTEKRSFRKVRKVNTSLSNCRIDVAGPRLRIFFKAELDTAFDLKDIIAVDVSGRRQFELKVAYLPREAPTRKYIPQLVYESGVAVLSVGFSTLQEYNTFIWLLFRAGIFMPITLDMEVTRELLESGAYHLLKRLPPVRKFVNDASIVTEMFPDWTVREFDN